MLQHGLAQCLACGEGSVKDIDGREDGFPEGGTWVIGNPL